MLEMPDVGEWLDKSAQGPFWVSLVLGALIAVEIAHASFGLRVAGPAQSNGSHQDLRHARRPHPGADVNTIVAAHLFGIPENTGNQDPALAPPTAAHLMLTGTMASADPKYGIAIVGDDGPSKVYFVGDSIGGATLHSVYVDRIILDRAGQLETLALPRVAGTSPVRGEPTGAPRTAAGRNGPRPAAPVAGKLDLADVVRVGASENRDGTLRGFHVYPGRNRAAFSQSGLRGGDLVVAVNGAPVEDQHRETGQAVFETVRTSSAATLTVERFGQRQDVTVDLAQADAGAVEGSE